MIFLCHLSVAEGRHMLSTINREWLCSYSVSGLFDAYAFPENNIYGTRYTLFLSIAPNDSLKNWY